MEIKNTTAKFGCHPGQPKKEAKFLPVQTEKATLKQLQYDTFQKSAKQ